MRHLAREGREARVLERAQVVPGDVVHQEAEAAEIDPALERDVEGVQRMLAHFRREQLLGERVALGAEAAQQAAVDEALVRLVGADLRLHEAVLGRRALVDEGLVLLDRGELGGGEGVDDLHQRLAVSAGVRTARRSHAAQVAPHHVA